jgi:hypothetical protein
MASQSTTMPGEHRYKGWCVSLFYGFGPAPGRARRGKFLFLEQYRGGGKKKGGWCKEEAVRLIRKGWLNRARRRRPRKKHVVQADRDGAFTSAYFHRSLRKLNTRVWNTMSRASDVAPIEKAIGFAKRLIEFKANSTPKWRNGVKDTAQNRVAWARLCTDCVRSITKQPGCAEYYTKLIGGMSKVPQKLVKAKGNRIRG